MKNKHQGSLIDLEADYRATLKPYTDSPSAVAALAALIERPTKHGKEHKVICGECMAGRRPVGSGVFESTDVDPQKSADALRAHYAEVHP